MLYERERQLAREEKQELSSAPVTDENRAPNARAHQKSGKSESHRTPTLAAESSGEHVDSLNSPQVASMTIGLASSPVSGSSMEPPQAGNLLKSGPIVA